jgi:hypothetical protein
MYRGFYGWNEVGGMVCVYIIYIYKCFQTFSFMGMWVLYKCALLVLIVAHVFFFLGGGGGEIECSEFLNLWYKCYASIHCWCHWPCAVLFLVVCVF